MQDVHQEAFLSGIQQQFFPFKFPQSQHDHVCIYISTDFLILTFPAFVFCQPYLQTPCWNSTNKLLLKPASHACHFARKCSSFACSDGHTKSNFCQCVCRQQRIPFHSSMSMNWTQSSWKPLSKPVSLCRGIKTEKTVPREKNRKSLCKYMYVYSLDSF